MLRDSEYKTRSMWQILYSGVTKYYRILYTEIGGGRRLNSNEAEMRRARTLKQLKTKAWFRTIKGGKDKVYYKENPWVTRGELRLKNEPEEKTEHVKDRD